MKPWLARPMKLETVARPLIGSLFTGWQNLREYENMGPRRNDA